MESIDSKPPKAFIISQSKRIIMDRQMANDLMYFYKDNLSHLY